MRLAVVGSRNFDDYGLLSKELDKLNLLTKIQLIISGGAKGADTLAVKYALQRGIDYKEFLPDWRTHGKKAGIFRNIKIVDNCDYCIAFWDKKSRGTLFTLNYARKKNKPTFIVPF